MIIVEDNGSGIPDELQNQIFTRGFTHGKKNGKGLGLYFAKKTIEESGGKLNLFSSLETGTRIEIILPQAVNPIWFSDNIIIPEDSKVLIVDDNYSIHELWHKKLGPYEDNTRGIENVHTPEEFQDWFSKNKRDQNIVYLIDYEFIGSMKNGLELIEEFELEDNVYLVTSHFSDINIQYKCVELGVKLLPKNYVEHIPLAVSQKNNLSHMVLLEDNDLIIKSWKHKAEKLKLKLSSFNSSHELFSQIGDFDNNTTFFIDSNLGQGKKKGEYVAKEVFDLGFKNIYLQTGSDKNDFSHLPWIKGIIPKKFPEFILY